MIALSIVAGLLLLLLGGELFVRGAVGIARQLGVSPLLIGLTLVGFGTSTPELVTSLQAALSGSPGVATGNVIGSNIANILLILGLSALVRPVLVDGIALKRDGLVLALSAVLCLGVVMTGMLDRLSGLAFIAGLIGFLGWAIWQERSGAAPQPAAVDEPTGKGGWPLDVLWTVLGLGLTIGGATLLIDGAVSLATQFGVSETIIGLSIVAIGTSLPELVTSLVAAVRGQSDVAFGNIVGSNIYNILGILGVTALVKPIPVPREIMSVDIWVMLAATALLLIMARTGLRVTRTEGAILLAGYGGYTAWLASQV